MKILNQRPENMSFEDYKAHLRNQKEYIKNKASGSLVYKSWETIKASDTAYSFRKYRPFVGRVKTLKTL